MHRVARPFIAVALSFLAVVPSVASAQAEFEGAVTMNMNMGGQMSVDVVSLTKGGKVRQEMSMMGQDVVSIIDASAGTGLMLMPQQKTYMKLDLNALAERAGPMTPPKITATGKTETILGHTCENYTVEMPSGAMEMCVATGLGYYMGSLNAQGGGMTGNARLQEYNQVFRDTFKNGFFPLEMTMTAQGMGMTMVVTKIEPKPVSDDQFKLDIPAGFTEMKMPGGPGHP